MQEDKTKLGAPYAGRLKIVIGDSQRQLPTWADWLMALGEWMREQALKPGKRVVVVRLPVRNLAAAFVGLGALCAAARSHDESLDWEALRSLPEGTSVHWRKPAGAKSKRYSGRVCALVTMHGADCLAIDETDSRGRATGSKFYLPRSTALSHGVTLGSMSARTDEKLALSARFMRSLNSDTSLAWSRSPMADSTIFTERTSFLQDLEEIKVQAGSEPALWMLDALCVADTQCRTHGKLLVVPTRTEKICDAPTGVTILDGAAAISKLGHLNARSVVILMAHSEYDEEVSHGILPFLSYSVDAGVHAWQLGAKVGDMPHGVEAFAFGVRDLSAGESDDVH
jgi:hypothetical protein